MTAGPQDEPPDLGRLRVLASSGEPWTPDAFSWLFDRVPTAGSRSSTTRAAPRSPAPSCPTRRSRRSTPAASPARCPAWPPTWSTRTVRASAAASASWSLRAAVPGHAAGLLGRPGPLPAPPTGRDWDNVWRHGDWVEVDTAGSGTSRGAATTRSRWPASGSVRPRWRASSSLPARSIESAAVGVPDPVKGQAVVVFAGFDRRAGHGCEQVRTRSMAAVTDRARQAAQAGKAVLFVDDLLPHTRSGKILRRVVRAVHLGEDIGYRRGRRPGRARRSTEAAMSLRGAAAIAGSAELPPRPGHPRRHHAGHDRAGRRRRGRRRRARARRDRRAAGGPAGRRDARSTSPATVAEYLGLAPTVANVVDLGGASGPGMVWRAAAAIAAGMCRDGAVRPGQHPRPRGGAALAQPQPDPRVRRPLRRERRQPVLRDDGQPAHGRVRHHRRALAYVPVVERANAALNPDRGLPRPPAHRRGRTGLAAGDGAAAPARDRDAVRRWRGGRGHQRRARPRRWPTRRSPLLGAGEKVTHRAREPGPVADHLAAGPRDRGGLRHGRRSARATSTCSRSTTATRSWSR